MAGGRLEVSADFGPAWAHLVLGADGIVFFDPFHFEVEVYASIKAGVTIDVWIGEITINVSITGRVLVEGPKFHAKATFGVGPVDITVEFGDRHQPAHPNLPWPDFVRKYLEEAAPGLARVLTAIPGKGSLPPGTGPGGATDTGTADGSIAKPFVVFAEFEITVTSTVPTARIDLGGALLQATPTRALGLAPMGIADAATTVHLNMIGADGDHTAKTVTLYLEESFTFLILTEEAAMNLGVMAQREPLASSGQILPGFRGSGIGGKRKDLLGRPGWGHPCVSVSSRLVGLGGTVRPPVRSTTLFPIISIIGPEIRNPPIRAAP